MPTEADTTESESETQTEETPPPPAQTQATDTRPQSRGQFLPEATIGKLKKQAREKGKQDAMAALEQEAKSAGFSSYAEMKAFAADRKKQPAQPQRQPVQGQPSNGNGQSGVSKREFERLQQENANLNERVKTLQKENTRLAKRAREDSRDHNLAIANLELKFDALKAGVKPKLIPAAIALFREQIPSRKDGESEQAYLDRLKNYDQEKAFVALRETEPMLFVSSETPAPPPVKPPAGNGGSVPQNKAPGSRTSTVVAAPTNPLEPGGGGPLQGDSDGKSDHKMMVNRLKELGIENGEELLSRN